MNNRFTASAWALLCGALLAWSAPAGAQTNLLTNGSFETDGDGKTFTPQELSSSWRFYALEGADGSATIRGTAASVGNVGLELVRGASTAGDSALDKGWLDPSIAPKIPAEERIYKALADVKDGSINGGSNQFMIQLWMGANLDIVPSSVLDPGAQFETIGVVGTNDNSGHLDVRLSTPVSTSVLLDNVRLYDVTTDANRLINGGFENSASRVLNFSLFSNTAGECTMALSNDAHSGSHALQITRNGVTADGGWGHGGTEVPTFGGERLRITTWAKKASGDAATRLWVGVIEHNGTDWTYQNYAVFEPGSSYTKCVSDILLRADTKRVYFNFRVGDNNANPAHVGSYLIDDLDVRRPVNIVPDGDFEAEADGQVMIPNRYIGGGRDSVTALSDLASNWRLYDGATSSGTATFRAAAASQGGTGLEIVRETMAADLLVDRGWGKDSIAIRIPASLNVYKLLTSVKDGGQYGGTTNFSLPLSTWNVAAGDFRMFPKAFDPAAQFETIGVAGISDGTGNLLDVRLQPNEALSSAYVDDVRVYDVTLGDRMINGGFENSASRALNWRTWGALTSAIVTTDTHGGTGAVRIERATGTSNDDDGGFATMDDPTPVIPGETLNVELWAKKAAGDADARLVVQVNELDANNTWPPLRSTLVVLDPVASAYGLSKIPVTVGGDAAYVNVMLRVGDSAGYDRHVGAYLVDDVSVMRDNRPSITGAMIAFNDVDAAWHVSPTGWSDADADAEQYQYQWTFNGVAIPGATRSTLTVGEQPAATGTVACLVTPYDGVAAGITRTATETSYPTPARHWELMN